MTRKYGLLFLFILCGCFLKKPSSSWNVEKIAQIFEQSDTVGTFVVYDVKDDRLLAFNEPRAHQLFYPASTFKIANSLIALKTRVVHDEDEVFFHYDGYSKFFLKDWESDASLRSGIKVSHVPAFQELARRIGLEDMRKQLDELGYGNREVGTGVDKFWLEGPLRISAIQQVYFLASLGAGTLPYPEDVQEAVREICELERGTNWVLYGKTGWASKENDPGVGWFVGWVAKKKRIYSFALNMDMANGEKDLEKRVILAKKSLQTLGII